MKVSDAMTTNILTIGPGHTLRQSAALMSARRVGAAVVLDPDHTPGVGILTERDILNAIGSGGDPDVETAGDHLTSDLIYAGLDWSLEDASATMVRGGFRHLVILEDNEVIGIISVRDILRVWSGRPVSVRG
ncbi:MAG: CBS domain-containing protein [Corynebacteriales bacterium]|nr:CBS domain-containing protein [Mycobacteriales bacterium]